MSPDRWDRLIDVVLDGEATAAERIELERHLAGDPESRARMARRRVEFERLRDLPRPGPAEDLRSSVLAEIRGSLPGRGAARRGGGPSLVTRRRAWIYGYAAAAAVVVVTFIALARTGTIGRKPGPGAPTAGTMGWPVEASVVDRGICDLSGAVFRAEARVTEGALSLRFRGSASQPAVVTIGFAPDELQFVASRSTGSGFEATPGRIRFTAQAGSTRDLTWAYSRSPITPISVLVRVADKEETMTLRVSSRSRASPTR